MYKFLFTDGNIYEILEGLLGVLTLILGYLTLKRGGKIKRLKQQIEHLKEINLRTTSKVNPEHDRIIIGEANKSIQVLDINSLALLHHCPEEIISFLKRCNGNFQVLLLDPAKECFHMRMGFEGDTVGRMKSEWDASVTILAEIRQMAGRHGEIELRLYDQPPDRYLLIIDALDKPEHNSSMLINYYPKTTLTRGYLGGQFLAEFGLLRDRDSFEGNRKFFSEIWKEARQIELAEAVSLKSSPVKPSKTID